MEESLFPPPKEKEPKAWHIDYMKVILRVLIFSLIGFIAYKFFKDFSSYSDDRQILTGTQHIYPNGSLYFFAAVTQLTANNYFTSIYSTILTKNSPGENEFSIDVSLSCLNNKETTVINQNIPSTPIGHVELYTTWYPIYDHMIVEMMVSGTIGNQTSISLMVIKSNDKFAHIVNNIHSIIKYSTIAVLILFLGALFWRKRFHFSVMQYFSILSMTVVIFANLQYNHQKSNQAFLSKTIHCVDLLLKGAMSAINIVAIFTASMKIYESDGQSTALAISTLFIFAEAMCSLTTDSYVVANLFDNNGVIWVFFFSASMISKITLAALTLHHLIVAIIKSRRKVYAAQYILALTIELGPQIARAILITADGFQNSTSNFFCEYVSQAAVALMLAALTLPGTPAVRNTVKLPDIGGHHFDIARDSSVQFDAQTP